MQIMNGKTQADIDREKGLSGIEREITAETFDACFAQDEAKAKEALCAVISGLRLTKQEQGFTYTDGIAYPINHEAQVAYTGQITAAQIGIPFQCFAHTMDNRQIEMSLEEMLRFCSGVFKAIEKINKDAWKAKEAIRKAKTAAAAWSVYEGYLDE